MSFTPTPNLTIDGNAAPSHIAIIAGVDSAGDAQSVFVGTDGAVLVREAGFTGVGDGSKTVTTAGNRVQLDAQACKMVIIQAHDGNSGQVVAGGSTVIAASGTRRGFQLFPTQSLTIRTDNLNNIYIDSTQDGDKITFIYFT